jgi:hypothetical protein
MCQQNDLSVRELKRVVMTVRVTPVDLAETGHLVRERAAKNEPDFASHLVLKGKLGARNQTNSQIRIFHRGKTARGRLGETRRYQLVA